MNTIELSYQSHFPVTVQFEQALMRLHIVDMDRFSGLAGGPHFFWVEGPLTATAQAMRAALLAHERFIYKGDLDPGPKTIMSALDDVLPQIMRALYVDVLERMAAAIGK